MEIRDDAEFGHDEADITMVSCVTEAANSGKSVIRIYSDDTDVFVPLVCCVCVGRSSSARCRWTGAVDWDSAGYQRHLR